MTFTLVPDPDFFKQIVAEGEVTTALDEVAGRVYKAAKQDALAQGLTDYAALLHTTQGTRPKGRTYARVTADDTVPGETREFPTVSPAAYEWGDETTRRRRILGTAAAAASSGETP